MRISCGGSGDDGEVNKGLFCDDYDDDCVYFEIKIDDNDKLKIIHNKVKLHKLNWYKLNNICNL